MSKDKDGDEVDGEGASLGLIPEFGSFGPGAFVTERGLAALFGRSQISIKRAVHRGELPQPTKLMGEPTWTIGAIVKYIEKRLADEAEDSVLRGKTC